MEIDSLHTRTDRTPDERDKLDNKVRSQMDGKNPLKNNSFVNQSKASKDAVNIPDHFVQPSVLSESREANFGTGISKNLIKLYNTKYQARFGCRSG